MKRLLLLLLLCCPAFAQAPTPQDLRTLYDLVRQGLCAANLTCAFPQDALFPADYRRDVEPLLLGRSEIILVGTPADLGDALATLRRRLADPAQAQSWPRLYIVTAKEHRAHYRLWETEPYKPYVTVVDSSSNDSLSALSKFGFPLVLVDNTRVWIPSWYSLDGPTVASVVLLARQTIQTLRNAQAREAGTK
jgi:hypothetical protein